LCQFRRLPQAQKDWKKWKANLSFCGSFVAYFRWSAGLSFYLVTRAWTVQNSDTDALWAQTFVVAFSLLGSKGNQPRPTNILSAHNQKNQHTCAAQVTPTHNQTRQKTSLKQKSHLKQRKVVLDPTPSASTQRKKLRRANTTQKTIKLHTQTIRRGHLRFSFSQFGRTLKWNWAGIWT
jgi:hypothetical protein